MWYIFGSKWWKEKIIRSNEKKGVRVRGREKDFTETEKAFTLKASSLMKWYFLWLKKGKIRILCQSSTFLENAPAVDDRCRWSVADTSCWKWVCTSSWYEYFKRRLPKRSIKYYRANLPKNRKFRFVTSDQLNLPKIEKNSIKKKKKLFIYLALQKRSDSIFFPARLLI